MLYKGLKSYFKHPNDLSQHDSDGQDAGAHCALEASRRNPPELSNADASASLSLQPKPILTLPARRDVTRWCGERQKGSTATFIAFFSEMWSWHVGRTESTADSERPLESAPP